MPATKSLSKIQKNLKSSGKSHVHPNGRKYQQLARATLRENSLAAKKREHQKRKSCELARIKFVQDLINSDSLKDRTDFSHEELTAFLQEFIQRDNKELKELKKNRRKNRPPSNRQIMLEQKLDREIAEFEIGFLAPDLSDEKNVTILRNWNGTFGSINSLKTIRLNRKGEQVIGGNASFTPGEDVEMQ